jgi:hypothetical protein
MAITTSPLYPKAGELVTLSVSSPTGNTPGYHLDSSPSRSTTPTGFLSQRVSTGQTIEGAEDDENSFDSDKLQSMIDAGALGDSFTPDVSGEYTFTAYETREVAGIPSYPGDPAGTAQTLVTKQTTTVYVGELMTLPLVTEAGHGADLQVQVNNNTVRSAELINARTDDSTVAAKQTAVVAALDACVGVDIDDFGATFLAAANELRATYEGHRVLVSGGGLDVHVAADTTNTVGISAATDEQGAVLLLNDISDQYVAHCKDSSSAGTAWHYEAWYKNDDLVNLPLAAKATDLKSAVVLLSDLRIRCYERHRQLSVTPSNRPYVHNVPDTSNNLAISATALDDVIETFFNALITTANTAQDGENQGEVKLRSTYGFARVIT